MSRNVLFFVNPKAGQQELRQHLLEVLQVFSAADCCVTIHLTQSARDITEQVLRRGKDYDMIVCAGGDGTQRGSVRSYGVGGTAFAWLYSRRHRQ